MFKWFFTLLFTIPIIGFCQFSTVQIEANAVPQPITRDTAIQNWNSAQPLFSKLSPESKEFLYWVNYSRNNPVKFWDSVVNPIIQAFPSLNTIEAKSLKSDFKKAGRLPMFSLNEKLINTAQFLAGDIAGKKAAPSHTSTNGDDFGKRMMKAGIKTCAGENISLSGQGSIMAVVLLYLDINLPDLGHRKTLLDHNLVETGIGYAPYGKKQLFFVQDFACTQQ